MAKPNRIHIHTPSIAPILLALAALAALAAPAAAAPVPARLSVQGVLRDENALLTSGRFDLAVALYDNPAGGAPLYVETMSDVLADGGVFSVLLGETASLPPELFADYGELYLGVAIDGAAELTPRVRLAAQAWALQAEHANRCDLADHAGDADTLAGLAAGAYQRRVLSACAPGSSISAINADGSIECEADDDTSYGGGAGIAVTGTTISLASAGCMAGDVWKYDGADWQCVPDEVGEPGAGDVTDVIAGDGLTGGGAGGALTLAVQPGGITATHIADGAVGAAEIGPDAVSAGAIAPDAVTSAAIGADAVGSSELVNLALDCTTTTTTCTSATSCSVTMLPGYAMTGGGCVVTGAEPRQNYPFTPGVWRCTSADGATITAYAIGCRLP